MENAKTARSPFRVTVSVWKALFLREAVHRLFGGRAAWLWLLFEPVVHVVFLMLVFTFVRMRVVGGIDTAMWLMIGLLSFFMFKRTASQGMNAVGANKALFAYRQVTPVDTVLTRAAVEGFLMVVVTVVLFVSAAIVGLDVVPEDPLAMLEAFFGLWAMGLGFSLMVSVANELVPELGKVIGLLMTPLYLISGVILPLAIVPPPYREWAMLNPMAHGVEAARLGFAPYYQAVPELNIGYLFGCALAAIFLGLALHTRFATRLVSQ